ncbi:hypothetical protein RISK_000198 [Rhodopirellula islandica]|uniref:Uncharacterized protein n=1 Tax=Rhodopirellula islandica TaxID=595434 RepID=A0A0J1BMD5_RHOIS|nr:hypothetical protein RISK_000198 [Rhodopirellula islandica]
MPVIKRICRTSPSRYTAPDGAVVEMLRRSYLFTGCGRWAWLPVFEAHRMET